jgi:diadenylate cyclase
LLIGKSTTFSPDGIFKNLPWKKHESADQFDINPVIDAAKTLGGTNTGALIVFSRESELKFYVDSGDKIDGEISKRLLLSIFNKNSPLHDGAVIIHDGRISAARCILPVSDLENLPAQFGLRHRAAIGMSETTDTLVLVVSEETGQMSVVRAGKIHHNMSIQEIRKMINEYFSEDLPAPEMTKTKFEKILEEGLNAELSEAEQKPKTENSGV